MVIMVMVKMMLTEQTYCFDENGDTPESLPVEVSPRAAKASKELADSAFLEATAAGNGIVRCCTCQGNT